MHDHMRSTEADLTIRDQRKSELLRLVDELKDLYGIRDSDIETYCGRFRDYFSMLRRGVGEAGMSRLGEDMALVRQLSDEYLSERRMPHTVASRGVEVSEFLHYLQKITGLTRKQIAHRAGISLCVLNILPYRDRVSFVYISALNQLLKEAEAAYVPPEEREREARRVVAYLSDTYGVSVDRVENLIGRPSHYFSVLRFRKRFPRAEDIVNLRTLAADFDSGKRDPISLPLDRDAFCQLTDYFKQHHGLSFVDIARHMDIDYANFMPLRRILKRIPFSYVEALERLRCELETHASSGEFEDIGGVRVVEKVQTDDVVH